MSMGHVKSAKTLLDEMQGYWDRADGEGRDLTMSERTEVEGLLEQVKSQKSIEDLGRQLGAGMPEFMRGDGSTQPWATIGDPGAAFVNSEGYKKIKSSGSRSQRWTSGPVEVALSMKGTILEGTGAPGSGT